MTVKSIIGECLVKMGRKNFVEAVSQDGTAAEWSDDEKELANALLYAINLTYREIVEQHFPLICKEDVCFVDKKLMTSTLEKNILYPVSLKKDEDRAYMKTFADRIESNFDGNATLEYAYMPTTAFGIDDSISDMRITRKVMADGALGKYYFANKMFDLAQSFDTSFRNGISALKYKGRDIRVKRRRWQA